MKETPLANCERDFVLQVIERKKRLDGRSAYDYRDISIAFGEDYGCCHVQIGDTMVMAQVTCNIVEPKQTRPNEGTLMINMEFNHVACPGYEPGRLSRKGVQINRLLERCIKECKCVDLESLCVIAEKQVWEVRVDIKVLNHAGNILDACSLAAISALSHFKRPDVSVEDGKITIHPADEKSFIPLSVHHMPICTSFSFFHSGNYLLLDASYEEERVMEGQMIIAMNKHREICALHMSGTHLLHKDQVKRCTNITAVKVLTLTELIQTALQNDKESRDNGTGPGSAELNTHSKVNKLAKKMAKSMKLRPDEEIIPSDDEMGGDSEQEVVGDSDDEGEEPDDDVWRQQTEKAEYNSDEDKDLITEPNVVIGSGGLSSWNVDNPDDDEAEMSEQTKTLKAKKRKRGKRRRKRGQQSDSEEEETVTLEVPE